MTEPFRYLSVDEVKQRYHRAVPSEMPSAVAAASAVRSTGSATPVVKEAPRPDGILVGTDIDASIADMRATAHGSLDTVPTNQLTLMMSARRPGKTAFKRMIDDAYAAAEAINKPALSQLSSDTSNAAAAAIEPHRGTLRDRVYRAIRGASHGVTAQEIEDATGIPGSTVRPRLVELLESNAIMLSHQTRKTRAGRNARTYFAAK